MTKLGKGAIAGIVIAGVVVLVGLSAGGYKYFNSGDSKDEKQLLPSNPDIEIFPDSDEGPSGGSRKHKKQRNTKKKNKAKQRKSKKR